ncbi:unnamed protein product [Rotaria sp. Silwood2]|nr:unnamed protein product [Rotaria sp. Silwood2]CAF3075002.1 unnamed protein product [Rotaria sp. Silwood2]CAF3325337.1 unnamed protein product [Rotaria sp. Silwood2]CAF3371236.1 unnamed protein product [Rotaria sp. Silwood2]CAF4321908.1 unnamed protein product [Rotaria sp. Silwood2]
MKAKNESVSLCNKIYQYIITPPLVEQCEKQQWFKTEAKHRREIEHQETLLILRSILDSHQEQQSSSNHDMILKLWFEEEPRAYKKEKRASLRKLFQRLLGEFIGTFILVLCYASMRVELKLDRLTTLENALGQGLVIVALVYSLGGISGAHFNPVVTLVFTLQKTFPLLWLPVYNAVQLTAAIAASGVLRALYKQDAIYGTNAIDLTILSSYALGFFWEIITSFFLLFVVLQTATRGSIIGPLAALAVGSINILTAIIGNINSSSMNPTRTLGPAIVNSSQDDRASLWVYMAGPYLGGVIAVIFVTLLNCGKSSSQDEDDEEMKMAQGENK